MILSYICCLTKKKKKPDEKGKIIPIEKGSLKIVKEFEKMNLSDIKISRSTLAELRGVLVRALSRENLSLSDKMAIRKSYSSSTLQTNYAGKGCFLKNFFSRNV